MADNATAEKKMPFILRFFAWLLGGLSLLNLIKDLDLVELYGKIGEWTTAYGMLVSTVGQFLFGWIEWRWIRVEEYENHVLVLAALISGTAGRAAYATLARRREEGPVATAAGMALGFIVLALIVVLLVPAPWSLWVGVAVIVFGCIGMLTKGEKGEPPDVDIYDFGKEMIVVAAIFIAIILANYMIFKPA